MNILETFELFLKRPISILKNGLVSIVHIKAENMFSKKAINVDLMKNKAQITVINNEKVYNLLKMATYRAKKKQELLESQTTSEQPKLVTETLLEINE
jgi:predicted transcriptional regulator